MAECCIKCNSETIISGLVCCANLEIVTHLINYGQNNELIKFIHLAIPSIKKAAVGTQNPTWHV